MSPSAGQTIWQPHRLIMSLIFIGATAAGWVMLPGDGERVAMLEQDGHSREALAILEHRFEIGDRSYRTLYQMQELYEEQGNPAKARVLLEEMSRQRPWDAGLKGRLAQFFKGTQDEAGKLAALSAQIDLKYSESACRELSADLRLMGDYVRETSVLQRCRQKGYRRPEDLSRLSDLLAAEGDLAQAAVLLRAIDDVRRLKTVRERYQLVSLLLDQEQPKEAERRSLRWIRAAKDNEFAVGLVDLIARSKYPESALELAKDAGTPGDELSLTIAERLLDQSQTKPARLYLRGWFDKTTASDSETMGRLIDAALTADDPEVAFKGAQKIGLDNLPGDTLARLAPALDAAGMKDAAADVRAVSRQREGASPLAVVATAVPTNEDGVPDGPEKTANSLRGDNAAKRGPPADPLEAWRKTLQNKMSDDASKRRQALLVGPPAPRPVRLFHGPGRGHARDAKPEARGATKFLKKTTRVLQRASSNQALKAKRRPFKESAKPGLAVQSGAPPPQPALQNAKPALPNSSHKQP